MKKGNICFYCGNNIDESNKTEEHIIPNYIGGKLKTKNILCKDCNSKIGTDIDLGFKDLEVFTNLLNPCRDRNKNINSNNVKCNILCDNGFMEINRRCDKSVYGGNFEFDENTKEFKMNYVYTNKRDLDKYFNTIIKTFIVGKMKKDGANNQKIEEKLAEIYKKILEKVDTKNNNIFYSQIQLNKTGKIFLSALKVIIEYFIYNNFDKILIKDKIDDLKNNNIKNVYGYSNYYFNNDFFDSESINHLIYLKGDNKNKILCGVLSIYGIFNCIFLLNDNYNGEDFVKSYYYDLITNKEIKFDKSLLLNINDVNNILFNENFDLKNYEYNLNSFMAKIKKFKKLN